MTRHATASTAGSRQRQVGGLSHIHGGGFAPCHASGGADGTGASSHGHSPRFGPRSPIALVVAGLALVAFLLCAAPTFAASVTDRPLLFSFDGSDTTAGALVGPASIAVDNSTGDVYVAENSPNEQQPGHHAISKLHADGTAATFSATGTSSLFGTPAGPFQDENGLHIAVDNSGGPTQGRLYVADFRLDSLSAFAPSGAFLWEAEFSDNPVDVAVDAEGHPWVLFGSSAMEFADSGPPPAQIDSFAVSGGRNIDIAKNGDVYIAGFSGVDKYVDGVFSSTVDPVSASDVYVDQSVTGGHLFVAHGESFKEYDAAGTEVGSYGAAVLRRPLGIAYNPALDRVYVGDGALEEVDAFGPQASGTTPDPTIEPTSVIGPGTAEFHGEVNPQSVPNAYYFEWSDFERVLRSPLQSLPEDSVGHSVSYKATNLLGNVNWNVRLVGVNTANGLRSASAADEFTPPQASAPPDVTIGAITAITPTTATVNGTINPHEDSVRWQARTSTDPTCSEGFGQTSLRYLPGGEVSTPVGVESELKSLLPAQHYCVLLEANNSFQLFGTGTQSSIEEFRTEAIPPSELQTAFVAPRTDTTAQLTGRLNPNGEANFTYRFEISEDGVNWTVLPERESSIDARHQIFVAEEATELAPDTTYYYRLADAENEAGAATSVGVVKTFTTRTTAEATLPQRGIEMVNNPDKGDQDVYSLAPVEERSGRQITADGNKVLWGTLGGAPGAYNATKAAFLAERTPTGWQSRSLVPPAAQQVGGGSLAYITNNATPDFSHFVFRVERAGLVETGEATRVSLDAHQHQKVLQTYSWSDPSDVPGATADMTDDGTHILAVNGGNHQLEEIDGGAPEVLSIMPDGTPSDCGLDTNQGASFIGGLGAETNGGKRAVANQWRPGYHMIDRQDASLVYFEAKPNGECNAPWGLYVRDRNAGETTLIDPGTGEFDAAFVTATPDGRHGYFATFSQLDPADTNSNADIYRWDQASKESVCMTCVTPDTDVAASRLPQNGGGISTIMISEDFSHIYFESSKQLVPGEGNPGEKSVYVLSGGEIRYVTGAGLGLLSTAEGRQELSADGKMFAWEGTETEVAGADTEAPTADIVAPGRTELYLYDDGNGSVECVSCVHGGITTRSFGGGGLEATSYDMSADGSTIAFRTPEALVQGDVNRGTDIYEWRNGGRQLVTNGITEFPEFLASPLVRGIDADGSNILFTVADPGLTGFELDGLSNLYVARIGSPGFEPPPPPTHCEGDSCQGDLEAPPSPTPSTSAEFNGHGNVAKKSGRHGRCAGKRGRARRRCVHRKHRHRHGKHVRQQGHHRNNSRRGK